MGNIASWVWVLIPLAAIGIAPFKMWMRMKERQLDQQSQMTAEKTAQYAAHTERLEDHLEIVVGGPGVPGACDGDVGRFENGRHGCQCSRSEAVSVISTCRSKRRAVCNNR